MDLRQWLSYDVIRTLARHKKLHALAVEDLMNTKSRTKVDWYSDHCFIILTLAKLIRLDEEKKQRKSQTAATKDQAEQVGPKQKRGLFQRLLSSPRASPGSSDIPSSEEPDPDSKEYYASAFDGSDPSSDRYSAPTHAYPHQPFYAVRTLQHYRGGANTERSEYMEAKSPLTQKDLAVSMEQVSIFLTSDNEVISFFEHSAEDILAPLISRLSSPETILRLSADGSMLTQALIDAIVDLAIPVSQAYDDVIGGLELDVLVDPSISQPKLLYILTSELTLLRSTVQPISAVVKALRDHRQDPSITSPATSTTDPTGRAHQPALQRSTSTNHYPATGTSVHITPLTHTYLGDVEDHVSTLSNSLQSMSGQCENLTDLIFQTMSAYQNESLKQLTLITIIFTPLTFLAGYYGMNFDAFWAVHNNSDAFFWYTAIPVTFATLLFLMKDVLIRVFARQLGKRKIKQRREDRVKRAEIVQKAGMRRGVGSAGPGFAGGLASGRAHGDAEYGSNAFIGKFGMVSRRTTNGFKRGEKSTSRVRTTTTLTAEEGDESGRKGFLKAKDVAASPVSG